MIVTVRHVEKVKKIGQCDFYKWSSILKGTLEVIYHDNPHLAVYFGIMKTSAQM